MRADGLTDAEHELFKTLTGCTGISFANMNAGDPPVVHLRRYVQTCIEQSGRTVIKMPVLEAALRRFGP